MLFRSYNKYRVPYFQALLAQARKQVGPTNARGEIVRRPGNPMLRYVTGTVVSTADDNTVVITSPQESLNL